MNWLQNSVIVIVCFLLARILIDAELHRHLVQKWLNQSRANSSSLVTGVLFISYFLSMFFPNTIVVLAMIPIVKFILQNISDGTPRKRLSTPIILALIYGANIGGMASLTGSPLNLVYIGYIEIKHIAGRDDITFFSWLMVGLPATLILVLIGRLVLKIAEITPAINLTTQQPGSPGPQPMTPKRAGRYILFFGSNMLFVIFFSALQFFYKPPKIIGQLNFIDLILLAYLGCFLFFAFLFPRGHRTWRNFSENLVFFLLFIVVSPLAFTLESLKEIRNRFNLRGKRPIRWLENKFNRACNSIWQLFFKGPLSRVKAKNTNAFISMNRLIYDLPFVGIIFMGLVLGLVYVILLIGDNPSTARLDGYVFRFFEELSANIVPRENHSLVFLLIIIMVPIFLTELINNTTVVLIMYPLIMRMAAAGTVNPLYFLLAITIAASGAFMTPIATSVNAIGYAGLPGVSLKRMLQLGLLLNLSCAAWLTMLIYLLN